jgi:hypothetical protein
VDGFIGAGSRGGRDRFHADSTRLRAGGLAISRERTGVDSEEDCERLFYRGYWKRDFDYFFQFLPIQNQLERLLELL